MTTTTAPVTVDEVLSAAIDNAESEGELDTHAVAAAALENLDDDDIYAYAIDGLVVRIHEMLDARRPEPTAPKQKAGSAKWDNIHQEAEKLKLMFFNTEEGMKQHADFGVKDCEWNAAVAEKKSDTLAQRAAQWRAEAAALREHNVLSVGKLPDSALAQVWSL